MPGVNGKSEIYCSVEGDDNVDPVFYNPYQPGGISECEYILGPGAYKLIVGAGHWPLDSKLVFRLHLERRELEPLPAEAAEFQDWLTRTKLVPAGYVTRYIDTRSPEDGGPLTVPPYTTKAELDKSRAFASHARTDRAKKGLDTPFDLVVQLNSTGNVETFQEMEKKFEKEYDETLFRRMLRVASIASGFNPNKILVSISGPLWSAYAYRLTSGQVYEDTSYYTASSGAATLPIPRLAQGQVAAVPKIPGFSQRLRTFLKTYFEQRGGQTQVLEEEADYLELLVRDLRGEITHGKDWEKIQICISLYQDHSELHMRVFLDGFLAAGLRSPAGNSGYQSMEPEHTGELTEYTRLLTTVMKTELQKAM
jgi:hypothetical protein